MKKIKKHKPVAESSEGESQQIETDLPGMLSMMYEKLVALEDKVDALLSKSSQRQEGGGHFQRPGAHFRRGGDRRDERSRERTFTKAVCAECGQECEVPFRPTGDRPVYCSDCFSARKDSGGGFSREEKGPRPGKKRGQFFHRHKSR